MAEPGDRRTSAVLLGIFALIGILVTIDLLTEYVGVVTKWHVLMEAVLMVSAAFGFGLIWRRLDDAREAARLLERDLDAAREEARRWREESREILRGLGEAIERQFRRWKLTPAEMEIGLLLLKGLSHKEIAALRDTSERTVRQQARSLYLKAGLSGRSELSAFFLEDLLPVRTEGAGAPGGDRSPAPTGTGAAERREGKRRG
ncbi:MAG: LuxR family transcriptional regulator [Acidobacteria bacterium]|nr:MAG: LuxR family transcriptional regulator [Acidobacteriota bacterium]